jgi:hypothetical protein
MAAAATLLLSGLRATLGTSMWLAPSEVVPTLGLGSTVVQGRPHPGFLAVSRMYGVRELAIASSVLYAFTHGDRPLLAAALRVGVLVDTVDLAAFAIAYAQGGMDTRGVAMSLGFGALYVALGAYAVLNASA